MPADARPPARRPGRRLRALGDAFHRTVKYALRPVDQEAFAQLFPTLRDGLVDSLYQAFKQARCRPPQGSRRRRRSAAPAWRTCTLQPAPPWQCLQTAAALLLHCCTPEYHAPCWPCDSRQPPAAMPLPLSCAHRSCAPAHNMQVVHQMRVFAEAEYEEAAEEHGLRDKLAALEELCEAQVGACLAACCRARASAWFVPSGAEQGCLEDAAAGPAQHAGACSDPQQSCLHG